MRQRNVDPAKAIERITKLIRLAAHNPNEEEARSAALLACKLMTEHKVQVRITRAPQPGAGGPPPPTPPAPPGSMSFDEFMRMRDEVFRDNRAWEKAYWDMLTGRERRR